MKCANKKCNKHSYDEDVAGFRIVMPGVPNDHWICYTCLVRLLEKGQTDEEMLRKGVQ